MNSEPLTRGEEKNALTKVGRNMMSLDVRQGAPKMPFFFLSFLYPECMKQLKTRGVKLEPTVGQNFKLRQNCG